MAYIEEPPVAVSLTCAWNQVAEEIIEDQKETQMLWAGGMQWGGEQPQVRQLCPPATWSDASQRRGCFLLMLELSEEPEVWSNDPWRCPLIHLLIPSHPVSEASKQLHSPHTYVLRSSTHNTSLSLINSTLSWRNYTATRHLPAWM